MYQDEETICDANGSGYFNPWWYCPAQVTRPSAVIFNYGFLSAGTHTIRMKAIAVTAGSFVLPPVTAYAAQQPEVMGMSAAGTLTVCVPEPTTALAALVAPKGAGSAPECSANNKLPPTPAPKSCPQNCNSNGSCNLSTGRCLCNQGFKGSSCAKVSAS